jgi:RimJ/RimL family protein N-acetyltransferase
VATAASPGAGDRRPDAVDRQSDPAPGPAATLSDGRVRLAPLAVADAAIYLRIYTDPALMRALGGALPPAAARTSFEIACRTGGGAAGAGVRRWWAIRDCRDGAGLGLAGLRHAGRSGELGVIVLPPCQGAGVAGRALSLLAAHGFDALALARLRLRHAADNVAMAAVAARLGCRRAGARGSGGEWLWHWPARR